MVLHLLGMQKAVTPSYICLFGSFCHDLFTQYRVCLIIDLEGNLSLLAVRQTETLAQSPNADRARVFADHPQTRSLAHGAEHSLTLCISQIHSDSLQTLNTFNNYYCQHLQAIPSAEYAAPHILIRVHTCTFCNQTSANVADTQSSFKQTLPGSRRQTLFYLYKLQ